MSSSNKNSWTSSRWFTFFFILLWFGVGFFLARFSILSVIGVPLSSPSSVVQKPKQHEFQIITEISGNKLVIKAPSSPKSTIPTPEESTRLPPHPQFFFADPNTTQRPLTNPQNPKVALVGYMDVLRKAKHELEWMFFTLHGSDVKADIILSAHPFARVFLPSFCTGINSVSEANATREKMEQRLSEARRKLEIQKCLPNGWPGKRRLGQRDDDDENEQQRQQNLTSPCNVRCLIFFQETDDDEAVRLNYPFLRSLSFPHDPVLSQLLTQDYDYISKTDLDVFITPMFLKLRPPSKMIYVGTGAYSHKRTTEVKIEKVAKELRLNHRGLTNVGATFFGESKYILDLTRLARNVTIYFLETQFGPDVKQAWPDWWKGVASMYGGEVAVNHMAYDFIPRMLDGGVTMRDRTCSTAQLHAWHQEEMFNKADLFNYNATQYLEDWNKEFQTDKQLLRFLANSAQYALYTAMHVKKGLLVPPKGVWKDLCW